jgi:hypothetical protein
MEGLGESSEYGRLGSANESGRSSRGRSRGGKTEQEIVDDLDSKLAIFEEEKADLLRINADLQKKAGNLIIREKVYMSVYT